MTNKKHRLLRIEVDKNEICYLDYGTDQQYALRLAHEGRLQGYDTEIVYHGQIPYLKHFLADTQLKPLIMHTKKLLRNEAYDVSKDMWKELQTKENLLP